MEPVTCPWKDYYIPKSNNWLVDKLNKQTDKELLHSALYQDQIQEIHESKLIENDVVDSFYQPSWLKKRKDNLCDVY